MIPAEGINSLQDNGDIEDKDSENYEKKPDKNRNIVHSMSKTVTNLK